MNIRPIALATTALAVLAVTGCTPQEGGTCDPKKDSSYLRTHTEHGKTTTIRLECKQVGPGKYEWRKP